MAPLLLIAPLALRSASSWRWFMAPLLLIAPLALRWRSALHRRGAGSWQHRTVGVVRWIVDAMNVIGSRPDGWWKDRHAAMVRLTLQLELWAVAEDRHVTVVFEKPPSPAISSAVVQIAAAPRAGADSADDEIVRLVRADERPSEITVVTSDVTLVGRVTDAGANTHPAKGFRDLTEPPVG